MNEATTHLSLYPLAETKRKTQRSPLYSAANEKMKYRKIGRPRDSDSI